MPTYDPQLCSEGRSHEAGFSVTEVVISIAVLSIALVAVMQIFGQSSGMVSHSTATTDLTLSMDRALEQIAEDVGNSGYDAPFPGDPGVTVYHVLSHPATNTVAVSLGYIEFETKATNDITGDSWPISIKYELVSGLTYNYLEGGTPASIATSNLIRTQTGELYANQPATRTIAVGVTELNFSREIADPIIEMDLEIVRPDYGSQRLIRRKVVDYPLRPNNN